MKLLVSVLGFAAFFLFSHQAFSQTASKSVKNLNQAAPSLAVAQESEQWSFYQDEESQTFYIDFESISLNISNVVVKSPGGKVLFEEEVLDLPVDSIYELDLNSYGRGDYLVELKSFTRTIKKKVRIQ